MKTSLIKKSLLSLTLSLWASVGLAQSELAGSWEGVLNAGGSEIDVLFSFEQAADGSYSGLLNAPDQPNLTDVPIDTIELNGDSLSLTINAVSGAYEGTIGDGSISGTWSQAGTSFELNLVPFIPALLTAETFALIEGSWTGELRPIPGGEMVLTLVMRFEENDDGEYVGFFSVPEQGASNLPIDNIEMDDGELTVNINQARIEIVGDVTRDSIVGQFNQGGQTLELSFARGEYQQDGLGITPLDYARISGPWNGEVNGLTMVIRIEQEGDQYLAFMDSPDQGAANIPIGELSVDGDTLEFAIAAVQGSFAGEISSEAITGTWTQAGNSVPFTFSRGDYVANADVPAELRERVSGGWRGTVNGTELVFQFTEADNGGFNAVMAIPSMGAGPLPLADMSLDGDTFSFSVGQIQAQFSGTIDGDEISGDWSRAGATNTLTINRE